MDRGDALSRATESLALAVRIRCQHNIVRSASETHHRREASSSAYNHRIPPVSSLQSELPSARTPSPHGIHRKTVAFSIDRIDTNRQCLDPLRQCRESAITGLSGIKFLRHAFTRRKWCGVQRSPKEFSVPLTAFSTSWRRPLRTDRCQPQIVRNLLADHVL
jgi:hypothetical protein